MQKKFLVLASRSAFPKQMAIDLVNAGHAIECAYSSDEALERLQCSLGRRRGVPDAMIVTEEAVAEAGHETNSVKLLGRQAHLIVGYPIPVIAMFPWENGINEHGQVTVMPGNPDLLGEVLLNVFSENPS